MERAMVDELKDSFYTGREFQLFFKSSKQSLVLKADAPHFTILAVSDDFENNSFRKREELLGKGLFEIFPDNLESPDGRESARLALMDVIASKNSVALPVYKYEIYSPEADGLVAHYWSNTNQPVLDENGEVAYIINTTLNITRQELLRELNASSKEYLLKQQERINKMFLNAPVGMALFTQSYVIEYANEAICRMWNKGASKEVTGKSIFELIPSLEDTKLRPIFDRVMESGNAYISKESPVSYNRNGKVAVYYFDLHFEPVYGLEKEVTGFLALVNEVTEQVLARRKIENAEERLRLASEATGIGSWELDLQTGKIIYSPIMAELLGHSGKFDLSQEELWMLVHPDDIHQANQAFEEAMETGIYHCQCRILRPDDQIFWIGVMGKVQYEQDRSPLRMIGTVMDITESKQEEIKKNDFIAIASHELKTPLTSLKAYAQFLKTGKNVTDPGFVSSIAGRIEGQINKMTKLVYSFLDLSRIESGKIEVLMEDFDLNQLIREVADDYVLQEKNHPLRFEPTELPLIRADRNKVMQVIDNLISNAIKYSPQGGAVTIHATNEQGFLVVNVEDHGIGIDNNHVTKIFERYYRIDDLQVKNASGFGIGLYLCADIIKRHHGEIGLHSEPGKGSNFYFKLPLQPVPLTQG